MANFFTAIFAWVGELFTKLWSLMKKILPYVLLALAVWFSLGLGIPALGIVGGWEAALLALGTSFVLAPDETSTLLSAGVAAMGDVLTTAGTAVGDALGATASSLFTSSGLLWIALGVGAYFIWKNSKDTSEDKDGSRLPPRAGTTTTTNIRGAQLNG